MGFSFRKTKNARPPEGAVHERPSPVKKNEERVDTCRLHPCALSTKLEAFPPFSASVRASQRWKKDRTAPPLVFYSLVFRVRLPILGDEINKLKPAPAPPRPATNHQSADTARELQLQHAEGADMIL